MVDSREPSPERRPPARTSRSRLISQPQAEQPGDAYGYESDYRPPAARRPQQQPAPVYRTERPPSKLSYVLIPLGLLALGVGAFLGFRALLESRDDASAADEDLVSQSTDDDDATDDGSVAVDGEEPVADTTGDAASVAQPFPAPVAPYVQATLVGKDMTLTGTVPSQELAEQITLGAQVAYAPFIDNQLQVDPTLETPAWAAAMPPAVILLQTITEGTVLVSEGQIWVTGRTGSDTDVARIQEFMGSTGLPVNLGEIEVLDLRPAIYVLAAEGGQLALSGSLPNEEIRSGVYEAAVAVYGAEEVLDASTVDPGVEPGLWMYNPAALVGALSAFPEYEVRLGGGGFTADLAGGNTFAPGSAQLEGPFVDVLGFGLVVMLRDPTVTIRIEGHTDADGADELNLTLSQARADAVAGYFQAGGIGAERITAIGVGEAEPVADNSTAEGRARNRRVELTLESTAP